jgi:hypothetical protein
MCKPAVFSLMINLKCVLEVWVRGVSSRRGKSPECHHKAIKILIVSFCFYHGILSSCILSIPASMSTRLMLFKTLCQSLCVISDSQAPVVMSISFANQCWVFHVSILKNSASCVTAFVLWIWLQIYLLRSLVSIKSCTWQLKHVSNYFGPSTFWKHMFNLSIAVN